MKNRIIATDIIDRGGSTYPEITGTIEDENVDRFSISKILKKECSYYELTVREKSACKDPYPKWHKLSVGSKDFCFGVLLGLYKDLDIEYGIDDDENN